MLVLDRSKESIFRMKMHHPMEAERIAKIVGGNSLCFDRNSGRIYIGTDNGLM